MGTINAYRDSSNPQLVHIVPSGFISGESLPVNLKLKLTGYDEKNLSFTVGSLEQGESVILDTASISGYSNETFVIKVISPGEFTASSSNHNLILDLDQSGRTITVTVPTAQETSNQTGNITVNIPGLSSSVVSVNLTGLDVLNISGVPSGQNQYITETIRHTVSGTTKQLEVASSDPTVQIVKVPEEDYVWDVTATVPNSNVTISFSGTGVKTKSKIYNFQDLITLTASPANPVTTASIPIEITIEGGTNIQATSDNPSINLSVDDHVVTAVSSEYGYGNITVTGDHCKDLIIPIQIMDMSTLEGKLDIPSGRQFVGEVYRLTIVGSPSNIECTSTNSRIKITQASTSPIVYEITSDIQDGITGFSGDVKVTADNMKPLIVPISFRSLMEISLSEVVNDVPFDIEALFKVNNGMSDMVASSSVTEFSPVIKETPNGYVLSVTSTAIKSGEVSVTGRGLTTAKTTVNFTDKDTISATLDPDQSVYYIGEPGVITVSGTERPVKVESENPEVIVSPVEGEDYKWTVDATKPVVDNTLTISGKGVKSITKDLTFKTRLEVETIINWGDTFYPGDTFTIEFKGSSKVPSFNVASSLEGVVVAKGEGDIWNVTCNSAGLATLTVTGTDMIEFSIDINVLPLLDLVTSSDSYASSKDESIEVAVLNATRGELSVDVSDPKISAEVMSRYINISASDVVTGTVTIKGRGYNDKTINVVFDNRSVTNLDTFKVKFENGLGEDKLDEFVGMSYTVFVEESPLDVALTCEEPRVNINKTSLDNGVMFHCVTDCSEGLSSINTVSTLTGTGFKDKTIPLEYQEVEVPSVSEVANHVTFDKEVILRINGLTRMPVITLSDDVITYDLKQESSAYVLTLRSSSVVKGKVCITGPGIYTVYQDIEFVPLNMFDVKIESNVPDDKLYSGDVITLLVKGIDGVTGEVKEVEGLSYNVDSSGDVDVVSDPLEKGKITLSCDSVGNASITLSAPGYLTKNLNRFTWIGGNVMGVVDIEALGVRFVNETISIKIVDAPVKVTPDLGGNEDVVLTKISNDFYTLTSSKPTKGSVTFSGRGYVAGELDFEFIDYVTLDLTSQNASVSRGESAEIKIPAQIVPFEVVTSSEDVKTSLVKNEDNTTSIFVTSEVIGKYEISIVGRGLTVTPAVITFKPEDIASIVVDPGTNLEGVSYTNEEITFSVVGTEKKFSVAVYSDTDDFELTDLGNKKFRLTKKSGGLVKVVPTGVGVKGREVVFNFLDVVVPSLGYNLEYSSFYINEKPLLFVSENVTTDFVLETDDGEGNPGVITCTPYKNNPRCFEVSTLKACSGDITIKGRGLKDISIPCIFDDLKQANVTFIPGDKRGYITKGISVQSQDEIDVTLVKGDEVVIEEVKE